MRRASGERWLSPANIISIAVGVVSLVVAIVLAVVIRQPPTISPAEHIATCRKTHGAPINPKEDPVPDRVLPWGDCAWPPVTGSDDDGFGHGTARVTYNPDAADSTSPDDHVVTIVTPCDHLQLVVREVRQGVRTTFSMKVDNDQVLDWRGKPTSLPPFIDQNAGEQGRLYVVLPHANGLYRASCAD